MSGSASSTRAGGGLAALLAVAALLLAAAALLSFTQWGQGGAPVSSTAPTDALYGLAVDAEGAVAGNEAALASFQSQLQQLKDAAAANPGAPFAKDARFARLLPNARR